MEVGIIKELDEKMNQERLRLIALGRAKEAELGKKEGELFSTVLITEVEHIVHRWANGFFSTAGGYYSCTDKSIKILASLVGNRVIADEIMLHELAHGLDQVTEGYTERMSQHDERFIIAARTLGADVSRYIKDRKQRETEKEYEEEKRQNYIPTEFSTLPGDKNSCSMVFNIARQPTMISRASFTMTQAYTDIYGDWKKDVWTENRYVMCGWGTRENIEFAQKLFPELEDAIRKTTRKHAKNYPLFQKNDFIEGIRYGFIYSLREQGFKYASNFDLSYVEHMKKRLNDKKVSRTPVYVSTFWKAFEEGNQLAKDIMNKYPKAEDNNE